MRLSVEFPANPRSVYYQRTLDICRRLPGYRERDSDAGRIHSVEFWEEDFPAAQAVIDYVHTWKGTAYYIDGKLVPKAVACGVVWDASRELLDRFSGDVRRRARLGFWEKIWKAKYPRDLL